MNEKSNPMPMMYKTIPAVAELNKVPGFDPLKFLRHKVSRKTNEEMLQLELPYQKLWFRLRHPQGRMKLTTLRITEQLAIMEARVYLDRSDAEPISSYISQHSAEEGTDYVQAAQDEALSAALSDAGFGLQFADVAVDSTGKVFGSSIPLSGTAPIQQPMPNAAQRPVEALGAALRQSGGEVHARPERAPQNAVEGRNAPARPAPIQKPAAKPVQNEQPPVSPVQPVVQQMVAEEKENMDTLPAGKVEENAPNMELPVPSREVTLDSSPKQDDASEQPAASVFQSDEPEELPVAPVVQQEAPDQPVAPSYTESTPVEDILKVMTFEEAQNVVVDSGLSKGKTMATVAKERPVSLKFYLTPGNKSTNNIVRAAAQIMLDGKEKRQFITYNSLIQKWSESKLDRLDWKRQYWYTKAYWISDEDETSIQAYLNINKKAVEAIRQFQRDVRDEQLEQRHRRETDPWDKDMEQVPELPKDWSRWVDKVAIRQNYIYYHYKKGGAKTGYCTYCEKEVPIKVHPHHNQQGRCICCRHPVVFKAYGRAGYMQTEKHFAYLIQRCKDGFVVREFQADRTYGKESLPNSKLYCQEIRRTIYDRERKPRTYYWGLYKQRNMRWISGSPCSYSWSGSHDGRVYGKTLPTLEQQELRCTGLVNWIRKQKSVDPEKYLAVLERIPQMEQISKVNLPKLTKECFSSCGTVSELIKNHSAGSLIKALGLDSRRFQRLRLHNGGCDLLRWLQYEKGIGREIPDNVLLWMCQQDIEPGDVQFIADRMSMVQVYNYVRRQMPSFRRNSHEVLRTWEDYLSMAKKLHMNVYDEIVYRTRKLRRRHDDLVLKCQEKDIELQAEEMEEKFPHVNAICQEIKAKYEYADADYMVVVPDGILDIITEGRALHHCAGSSDRYWDRIERRESFVVFLRKTADPFHAYYTLEVEPDGTVRQKRTEYDRQKKDIEQATEFLQKWQRVITARLTESDKAMAAESRILREKEFIQLKKDRVIIHTGHLAGRLLADVLMADLMENTDSIQSPVLAAAA